MMQGMKLTGFYLFFIHLFLFNTYVAMDRAQLNTFVEKYQKMDKNDLLSESEKIFKKAEYKANRLMAYKRKCFISEEGISFFGISLFNGLYIKYVDQEAKIIAEKKIATYKKGHCFSFLADINQRGDAIVYDTSVQSLIAYTKDQYNKINCVNYKLSKELLDHAPAKQIYYLNKHNDLSSNDKTAIVILVYDNKIYAITIAKNQFSHKKIFSIEKKSETIFTTACAFTKWSQQEKIKKNIVWVVLEEQINSEKKYNIQSIILDKE
ncbi:MAG TPA: hypothetical protein VL201_02925 [Patescibacteria group bacterium]|jgi:hypothetical protein|nr:hypothetical protein [Patescibacteria group bacterium]